VKSARVELVAPNIKRWQAGSHGLSYVWTFDSGVAGPHVWVNALTHGNEICGAIVVDELIEGLQSGKWSVDQGKLTLSFANVAAFERFDPNNPFASRFVDEDFNRVWQADKLNSATQSSELTRARELRPLADSADYLLDIHSMLEVSPPLSICGPHEKGIEFAKRVQFPVWVVSDRGHSNGTRLRDYGGFGDPVSLRNALLVECGQHWEAASHAYAWQATWQFLEAVGAIDSESSQKALAQHRSQSSEPLKVVQVTTAVVARTPEFKFAKQFKGLEVVAKRGELIATDGAERIVAPYDDCVLVMPLPDHVTVGLTAVRLGRLI
jgi:predicted deacylase